VPVMKPLKRSFNIAGHKTSISLEAPFWEALREAAAAEGIPLARLVARIDEGRGDTNLSSAVRVWLLAWVRRAANPTVQSEKT
jgi:predicted DNA-binding ribbon-helix-helix protein